MDTTDLQTSIAPADNNATGNAMEGRAAHSFIVRGGRIVRFEQFVDSASVRAAMTS